uniref:Cf-4/9 disease resistance-like family protein n=1 Tax=Populus alba TaxID=43335 RepID=A0A4U5Q6W5_POPAL|nr:Cf-4/9 disease resistance-like family protein [Populus alba]
MPEECSNGEAPPLPPSKFIAGDDSTLFEDGFGWKAVAIGSASLEYCQYPFPKTESWIDSTDCCSWDGVTCDMKTGPVTGLDLSCSIPYGTLHSNSTLFLPASSSKARPL